MVGLKGPLSCLTQARYGITWGPIGSAIDCLAEVLDYTSDRTLFDRPLAANQAIQIRLADMARTQADPETESRYLRELARQQQNEQCRGACFQGSLRFHGPAATRN